MKFKKMLWNFVNNRNKLAIMCRIYSRRLIRWQTYWLLLLLTMSVCLVYIKEAITEDKINNQDGFRYVHNYEITVTDYVSVNDKAIFGNDYLTTNQTIDKIWTNGKVSSSDRFMANDISRYNNSKVPAYYQGYRNAQNVYQKCLQKEFDGSNSSTVEFTVRWSKNKDVLYCPTYKIGTTFWRRVFMIQSSANYSMFTNPYEIESNAEYSASKITLGNSTSASFKFMFTRNPYTRLFSFYIDKLYAPRYYFWMTVVRKAAILPVNAHVRNSSCWQLSFPEFIKYVIHTLETGKDIDPHWIPIEQNCHPCQVKYDYIGTLESFSTDVEPILEKLGLFRTVDILKHNGKNAALDDATLDTLFQAFEIEEKHIRKDFNCNFQTNVQRAWEKLQMKGLIGERDTLDMTGIDDKVTTLTELYKRARQFRMLSSDSQRRGFRNKVYRQYWKQISDSDIAKLEKLYLIDFDLFGYDQKLNSIQ